MKITKERLRQVIKEELESMVSKSEELNEAPYDASGSEDDALSSLAQAAEHAEKASGLYQAYLNKIGVSYKDRPNDPTYQKVQAASNALFNEKNKGKELPPGMGPGAGVFRVSG